MQKAVTYRKKAASRHQWLVDRFPHIAFNPVIWYSSNSLKPLFMTIEWSDADPFNLHALQKMKNISRINDLPFDVLLVDYTKQVVTHLNCEPNLLHGAVEKSLEFKNSHAFIQSKKNTYGLNTIDLDYAYFNSNGVFSALEVTLFDKDRYGYWTQDHHCVNALASMAHHRASKINAHQFRFLASFMNQLNGKMHFGAFVSPTKTSSTIITNSLCYYFKLDMINANKLHSSIVPEGLSMECDDFIEVLERL